MKEQIWEDNFFKRQAEGGAYKGKDWEEKARESIKWLKDGAEKFRYSEHPDRERIAAEKELMAQWLEEWITNQKASKKAKSAENRKRKASQKEALNRESNQSTWSDLPTVARRLKTPLLVKKETEKAYQVDGESGKQWLPKSVCHVTPDGVLIGIEDWWAKKKGWEDKLIRMTGRQEWALEQQRREKIRELEAQEKEYLQKNGLKKVKVPHERDGDSLEYVTIGNQRYKVVQRKGWTYVQKGDEEKYGPHLKGRENSNAYWAYIKPITDE